MNAHIWNHSTLCLHTLYFFIIPLHLCRSGTTSVGLTLPLRWWMKSTSLTEGEYGRPENNVNPAFPVCREQNGSWSHTDLLLGRCTDNIHFNFSPEGKFSRGSYWHQAGDVTAIFHQLTAWYQHNNLFLLIWGQFGFVLLCITVVYRYIFLLSGRLDTLNFTARKQVRHNSLKSIN